MRDQLAIGVLTILTLIGVASLFIPTKVMLRFDRRTGAWIYRNVLASSGDETRALRAAGLFYKIFSGVCILFTGAILIITLIVDKTQ